MIRRALILLAVLALPIIPLRAIAETAQASSFDQTLRSVGAYCATAASRLCFVRAFSFADENSDGTLSLVEAKQFHTQIRDWGFAHKDELAPLDRQWLFAGLLAVQFVGLPAIFESYDTDDDSLLTRDELAADFRLDDRPLHVVVRDRNAVNWETLQARLGAAAPFLGELIPKPS
jgi:hypothetical protein